MKTVLIGSGNVATHLGKALVESGHEVLQVYSRKPENAQELANQLHSEAISDLSALDASADLYLILVSDSAIPEIIHQLPKSLKGIVAHTSGSTPLSVFETSGYQGQYGVFYPVQTFSKTKKVDFSPIPLALEASDSQSYKQLFEVAESLSNRVFSCDSKQREAIHIAAVFACNFSNYLYSVAEDILLRNGLEFDLIRPLILETAEKAQHFSPASVQTGPAIRKDLKIIKQHLASLEQDSNTDPRIKQIYALISEILTEK